jgi:hypothetical protein
MHPKKEPKSVSTKHRIVWLGKPAMQHHHIDNAILSDVNARLNAYLRVTRTKEIVTWLMYTKT